MVKVASTIESASKVNGVIAIDAEGSVDVKSCTFQIIRMWKMNMNQL